MSGNDQDSIKLPDISFETLFNEIPCCISVQDRNLKIIRANDRFRDAFGEHKGRFCYEVYKNRSEKCPVCQVEATFADGEKRSSEETVRHADGREAHILINTTPLRNESGEIVAVMEMSTNVSEMKKLQSDLDESRKLYHSLFENVPCFITVLDKGLRMIEANRYFRETFGEIEGIHCYELCKGRSAKCDNCHAEKAFQTGESFRYESTVTCRDGRTLDVISVTQPVFDENGEIMSVIEMAADVTEQKKLEEALNETNKKLLQLFEEVPCYISVVDRNFNLVRTNRRFREDFGVGVGERCYEAYKHRDDVCLDCPVLATFADGEVHQSEEVVRSATGERVNVLCYTTPIRNEAGDITHVMEMSTNITEIRQLQDQLTSLGLLVGSTSHSIKGLLTGLDGGMYILNSGFERDDMGRIKKGWGMVKRNVNKVRRMILDLLYYAKEREPEFKPLDVLRFCTEVGDLFDKKAEDTGVLYVRNLDSDLGTFEVDAGAMRTLLVNLLENAFEACRSDTKETVGRVTFSCKRTADQIIFEIDDSGIGMDQETRDKIFTLFYSSKGAAGTGLGLFISNKIAEQHGGRILVDSVPGTGSIFRVSIPIEQDWTLRQE